MFALFVVTEVKRSNMKMKTYNIIWLILASLSIIGTIWTIDFLYIFVALLCVDFGCVIQKYFINK